MLANHLDERKFGRISAPDRRDRSFSISPYALPARADLPTAKHWTTGKVLDQGNTSHCVEYSGRQWLASSPIRNAWPKRSGWLYQECQLVDEWPGEEPLYEGTSVRALFKVLQRLGYVTTYGWAWDVETVVAWILSNGPMVLGTDWYRSMMDTDRNGFIHARGYAVGGHAYLAKGANRKKLCPDGSVGAVRICNSWGTRWGETGYAWLSFNDLQTLLERDGEACTAVEVTP